jgi:glutathione S-transferase
MSAGPTLPVLWHLKVSNYNEKARWALDYKQIAHLRRAAEPGRHILLAKRMAGTRTLPILVVDGRTIPDSTRIIEELERHRPDPPLYPADPVARRRALELEDFFDEELGAHARTLVVHHMLPDRDLLLGAFYPDMGQARRVATRASYAAVRRAFTAALGIDKGAVETAFEKVRAAGIRLRTELGSRDYLVGDNFTVADLTAAALVAPAVAPPEFPYVQPQRDHPALAPVREALAETGMLDWTREMYARHRGTSAEVRPAV